MKKLTEIETKFIKAGYSWKEFNYAVGSALGTWGKCKNDHQCAAKNITKQHS
ncbi:hypothetical protein [Staphylococcus xylosus]|uniref:hypothetical protein n=1 Tax=Staphylococcus xylosus TaxID=1288 RepID=UPI001304DF30|nr:hypothetical protein [Staphylococcus xylosus]